MHVVRDLLQVKWSFELVQIYFTFPTNLFKHVRLRQMFIILLSRQMTSPLAQYSRKFPHIKILRHHQSPLLVQKCQLKEPIKKATHVCRCLPVLHAGLAQRVHWPHYGAALPFRTFLLSTIGYGGQPWHTVKKVVISVKTLVLD